MLKRGASEKSVVIGGAGPSALALAHSLARRGAAVTVIAPSPASPWRASYAAWGHEISGLGVEQAIRARFHEPEVRVSAGERVALNAEYVRFSTSSLQRILWENAQDAGVQMTDGKLPADPAKHFPNAVVVDATGGALAGPSRRPDCFQTAYGKWIHTREPMHEPGTMGLMDYREASSAPASFLYSMQENQTEDRYTLFVQETVLASREKVSFSLLRERLEKRLSDLGVRELAVIEEELCCIPMGRPLPRPGGKVMPFGASASMVHPATGYQLAHALREADPVADALIRGMNHGPAEAIRAGLETLWPASKRRAWELYRWGAAVLAGLAPAEMSNFVRAFFQMPRATWFGFMTGTLTASEILGVMTRVFSLSPNSLRLRLVGSSARHGNYAFRSLLSAP